MELVNATLNASNAGLWVTMSVFAVGVLVGIAKNWQDIKKLFGKVGKVEEQNRVMWHGIVSRGYMEAEMMGLLVRTDDLERPWLVSDRARIVYDHIRPTLKATRERLTKQLGHAPDDEGLAFAFEADLHDWMLANACPRLGLKHHGCLAIACVLASYGE